MNKNEFDNLKMGIDSFRAPRQIWEHIISQGNNQLINTNIKEEDVVSLSFTDEEFIVKGVCNIYGSNVFLLSRKSHLSEMLIASETIVKTK